jgi:hypothetical protein
MSDYLLLRNPNSCPACGFTGRYPRNGVCASCGLRLFPSLNYNFQAFAAEVCENFWAFDKSRGWVHRDHLLIRGTRPQQRALNLKPLPEDYGKHTTPAQVASRGGRTVKKVGSSIP